MYLSHSITYNCFIKTGERNDIFFQYKSKSEIAAYLIALTPYHSCHLSDKKGMYLSHSITYNCFIKTGERNDIFFNIKANHP